MRSLRKAESSFLRSLAATGWIVPTKKGRKEGRCRAGVCTRAEVIFCVPDPLPSFFLVFTSQPSSHTGGDPLSICLHSAPTLFILHLNLCRPPFFLLDPSASFSRLALSFYLSFSVSHSALHLLTGLLRLALSFRIYAQKVRHAARDTLLA